MRGLLGYGRYDDDPECIGCPRAKSAMTPCVARDGDIAVADDGGCVGCGAQPADLLRELVRAATGGSNSVPGVGTPIDSKGGD
jgi:hypothetical protein